MKMFRFAVLAAALLATPAFAQWQVPNHSIPQGRGAGITGFGNAGPGAVDLPFLGNGPSADGSFRPLPNAGLANAPADTIKCNPTSGSATIQDCSAAGLDTNTGRTVTGTPSISGTDCANPVYLSGNTLYAVNVGAASGFPLKCRLIFINIDVYSGVGTGRGKQMVIDGITSHFLYPGQQLSIRTNPAGTAWLPDQPLNGAYGQVWFVAGNNVRFFTDVSGNDTLRDGLAPGPSDAFQTPTHCVAVAYQQVYMRNLQSLIRCSNTASQSQPAVFITAFYQLPNASITIDSATPGTQWQWNCPAALPCFQFGDNYLGGLTDIVLVGSATSPNIVLGHQASIIDMTNVKLVGNNAATNGADCDSDSHFNITAPFSYEGTFKNLLNGCPGSSWATNGALNSTATTTLNRFGDFTTGAKWAIGGGSTFGTTGLTVTNPVRVSGAAVINNASGIVPPGGAIVPTTGGQYCGAGC